MRTGLSCRGGYCLEERLRLTALKTGVLAMGSAGTFMADAAPGLAHDILIMDDERVVILG